MFLVKALANTYDFFFLLNDIHDSSKAKTLALLNCFCALKDLGFMKAIVEEDLYFVISWGEGKCMGPWRLARFIHELVQELISHSLFSLDPKMISQMVLEKVKFLNNLCMSIPIFYSSFLVLFFSE